MQHTPKKILKKKNIQQKKKKKKKKNSRQRYLHKKIYGIMNNINNINFLTHMKIAT